MRQVELAVAGTPTPERGYPLAEAVERSGVERLCQRP